jgi:hypothetical protein
MPVLRGLLALAGGMALLGLSTAARADSTAYTEVGQRVVAMRAWHCDGTVPDLEIAEYPAHGKLQLERADLSKDDFPEIQCWASTVPGFNVWYQPDPDYLGEDKFTIRNWGGMRDSRIGTYLHVNVVVRTASVDDTIHVKAGQRVLSHWSWNCNGPLPDVEIVENPQHGTLQIEDAELLMAQQKNLDCGKAKVAGVKVWYQPDPSYTGSDKYIVRDQISVDREKTQKTSIHKIVIE